MLNINNANESFQDFSKCNYELHWSWSNFFRHVMTCNVLAKLPYGSKVLEIGAADSPLEDMMKANFNKELEFTKTDINSKYAETHEIFDIEKEGLNRYRMSSFDAVICTEVIEHLSPDSVPILLSEIKFILKSFCYCILSTPTPQKPEEVMVWPEDHTYEFSLQELLILISEANFSVEAVVPWSLHEKDFIECTSSSSFDNIQYMPEGFKRALFAISANPFKARQNLLILKK